ncbi:MAG: ATPase domain-containing protein [Thermoplasmatales archaeon]|nr:ATPase domain-containing protein [Thermoplasmatales archaeon]
MMPEIKKVKGRVRTYVKDLDERMEGGVPKGYVVLVCGTAGSMKSSFTFNILYNAAKNESVKGLYISLEQERDSLLRQMRKLGMNIKDVKELVTLIELREPIKRGSKETLFKKGNWMEALFTQIQNYKKAMDFEILIIDSLDALYALTTIEDPRIEIFHFFRGLRNLGITTFIITEMPQSRKEFGKYEVESFLSDGIIHLAIERLGNTVGRFVNIAKMRETKHATDFFPLVVDENGFAIIAK